eukprot:2295897-Amphidinium_carterae.1
MEHVGVCARSWCLPFPADYRHFLCRPCASAAAAHYVWEVESLSRIEESHATIVEELERTHQDDFQLRVAPLIDILVLRGRSGRV